MEGRGEEREEGVGVEVEGGEWRGELNTLTRGNCRRTNDKGRMLSAPDPILFINSSSKIIPG